jgi:hypothetical protein
MTELSDVADADRDRSLGEVGLERPIEHGLRPSALVSEAEAARVVRLEAEQELPVVMLSAPDAV